MFNALTAAGSGAYAYRKWLDAVSDNIANINTARPTDQDAFQARYIVARSVQGADGSGGVVVAGAAHGDAEGRLVYQPDHPLADDEGLVRMPDIDLGDQMTQLMMAQRGYQANLAVVSRAHEAYTTALQIGR